MELLLARGRTLTAEEVAILDLALVATYAGEWRDASGRVARGGFSSDPRTHRAERTPLMRDLLSVPYDPAFLPLGNVSAPIIFTVCPAVVAALLYAALLQFVRKHAAMVFAWISAITFVVTLIPDFTTFRPSMASRTPKLPCWW